MSPQVPINFSSPVFSRVGNRNAPYTVDFVEAHLAAGRPLATLGLASNDPVVVEARQRVARARIAAKREARS